MLIVMLGVGGVLTLLAGRDSAGSMTDKTVGVTPSSQTMAQLLAQSLHSYDTHILDSLLDRADVKLIDNTVKGILD